MISYSVYVFSSVSFYFRVAGELLGTSSSRPGRRVNTGNPHSVVFWKNFFVVNTYTL